MRATQVGAVLLMAAAACGAVIGDRVEVVPNFNKTSFEVYSGYITVKGPFKLNPYDELQIHYQLDCSQRSQSDPLVTWHQGGPGGSSLFGAYTEGGYFQVSDSGYYVNPHAWNQVANMLYLESPAGSTDPIGFSYCVKDNKIVSTCKFDDKSQAEAYAMTMLAFYELYPEFSSNDFYMTGESYAGQYIPNIAYYMLYGLPPGSFPSFKGIMVGNGCWGGTNTSVACNGPNEDKIDVDLFFGKGLVSKKQRDAVYTSCKFANTSYGEQPPSYDPECTTALTQMYAAVGPFNVYDVYDNCESTAKWVQHSGKSTHWLRSFLRGNMGNKEAVMQAIEMGGGYTWACGGMSDFAKYFGQPDVQKAMHLKSPNPSQLEFSMSGPASVTLYPALVKKIRVLIYNGDADACVPYPGNEYWTTHMAAEGHVREVKAWHPWFVTSTSNRPAGYATMYNVTDFPEGSFGFVTIRLAGHMVPTFQPSAAFSMFDRFLKNEGF